ncbi:MAG: ABC transporter permease [Bacteroidota bacterium]
MIKNYIKIAFRNLLRFKVYSLINLFGLALGLTISVLILLFVTDELAFDKFHTKGNRIYKIVTTNDQDGGMETNAWPVAYKLQNEFPEVELATYTRRAPSNMMVNHHGKRYRHSMFYADGNFLKMFSFDLLEGDPSTALEEPNSIVITEDIKQRYFTEEFVLGKTLTIRDSIEFTVTGVVKNIPAQSHIQFDMLGSFTTWIKLAGWFSYSEGWGNFNMRNYLLLKEGTNIKQVQSKARGMYMENAGDWLKEMGMEFQVDFIPLKEVYLNDEMGNGFGPKGALDRVYLVSAIAVFILVLACINFINITTARSVYRAKEVGLRKIVGSSRSALFWQFMCEAFLLTALAFLSVAIIMDFTLPFFNELMNKDYSLISLIQPKMIIGVLSIVILVSFLSGFYPALILSGYKPVEVLKTKMASGAKGANLRRSLVVFQFFISGGLVLGTLLVLEQLDYMQNKDLGFNKDQVLVLNATRVPGNASHQAFRNKLNSISGVKAVSLSNAVPGRPGWLGQWAYPEGGDSDSQVDTEYMAIDEHYLDALGLKLLAGRNFDPGNGIDLHEGLIINETAVKEFGWETPENAIGKKITSPSERPAGRVIGVVKDYHDLGLQEEIWSQAMDYASQQYGRYYSIKYETENTSDLLKLAQEFWKEDLGDYEFEFFFLDEDFERQYNSEERLMTVLILFATITLIVAGIGLLGLVSFIVLSRTKEIGIRKVLGANVLSIASLLSKEFVLLVIIANVIASPIVWYFGDQWLNDFAYRMEIDPAIFAITLIVSILLALLTVGLQTVKAGLMNPIDTLRNE